MDGLLIKDDKNLEEFEDIIFDNSKIELRNIAEICNLKLSSEDSDSVIAAFGEWIEEMQLKVSSLEFEKFINNISGQDLDDLQTAFFLILIVADMQIGLKKLERLFSKKDIVYMVYYLSARFYYYYYDSDTEFGDVFSLIFCEAKENCIKEYTSKFIG